MAAATLGLGSYDPKQGIDYIKDPLYQYIPLTRPLQGREEKTERDILDNIWLQRLRRIRQTQATNSVYPGMEHSRFQHSIGVMHLAGRFARHWYSNFIHVKESRNEKVDGLPSVNYIEEVFRLAGLLHDVGHGPFSHTLDSAFKVYYAEKLKAPRPPDHERISQRLITSVLSADLALIRRSPSGNFREEERIDPNIIAWLVKPELGKCDDPWIVNLQTIITGFYCADTLDYLVRDAYHGGTTEYGTIDVERLIHTSFMTEVDIYVHRSSMPAIIRMLHARMQAYQNCYFHKTVRAQELLLKDLLVETLDILRFPNINEDTSGFLDKYYHFDEHSLVGLAVTWKDDAQNATLGKRWINVLNRSIPLKQAFAKELDAQTPMETDLIKKLPEVFEAKFKETYEALREHSEEELSKDGLSKSAILQLRATEYADLRKQMIFDSPSMDARRINPFEDKSQVNIYDRTTKRPELMGIEKFVGEFPMRMTVFRVFVVQQLRELCAYAALKTNSKWEPVRRDVPAR